MTKKAQEFIKRRQAQLLGAHLSGNLPGGVVRRADGVVVPAGMVGTSFSGDTMPYAKGEVRVQIRKPGEAWETIVKDDNLVVTQAERLMANAMAGVANSAFNYIELGDPAFPANAPALGDLTLQQTTNVRKAVGVTVNGNIVTSEVTFLTSEGNGFTYTESGLFTGPFAAGSMFARKAFSPIVKTASFEMRFQWLITFLVNPQSSGDCAGISLVGPSATTNETIYIATGGEASVAATFDFTVGAGRIDFFVNGQRMVRTRQYLEAAPALAAPIGGPAGNKGVNLVGFTLNPGDVAYLVHRTIS
jgi:hypothetical protein